MLQLTKTSGADQQVANEQQGLEAEEAITRAIERAHEVDEVVTLAMAESYTSWLYELKGDAPRALAHVRRAVELAERRGGASLLGMVYGELARALISVGQFDEAVESLEQSVERGNPLTRLLEDPRLALAQLERGEPDAARAAALHAVEKTKKSGARLFEAEARLTLATVLLRTGAASAREQVEAELARAEVLIDATGSAIRRPSVHEVRAEAAELEGDADARRRHLREAHRLFTEMGATGHAERVARELGL